MPGKGRPFAQGNPGGPGRPRREVEARYLKALAGNVPLQEWRRIVRKAVEQAQEGDAAARAWLSKHLTGDNPWDLFRVVEEMRAQLQKLKEAQARLEPAAAEPPRLTKLYT
jgi:hypothetical protein